MLYEIISDTPFSTDGRNARPEKKGDMIDLIDSSIISTLVRNEIIALPSDTKTADSAETVIVESKVEENTVETEIKTPVAIQEAMAFKDRKKLDEYAEKEHGIKLDRRKGLEKMKNEFCDKYQAKMQKIEIENKALSGAPENK